MKINTILTPAVVDELYFTGKTTVAIDVLRATTTIIAALNNGAKEIIPVGSLEFVLKASGDTFGGKTIRGGEKNMKKIDGFDLGNSPLEYTRETIEGKSIIFFTTNGTKAITKAKYSTALYLMAFSNLDAIVKKFSTYEGDFEIICAGRNNEVSLEDAVCAGMLISKLREIREDIELTDPALIAYTLYWKFGKNIPALFDIAEHGKLLKENGFNDDIKYCSQLSIIDKIPVFSNNSLKFLN